MKNEIYNIQQDMSANEQKKKNVMAILQQIGVFSSVVQKQKTLQKVTTILRSGSLNEEWQTFARQNIKKNLRQTFLEKLKAQVQTNTIYISPVVLAYDQIIPIKIQLNIVENQYHQHYYTEMESKINHDLKNSVNVQQYLQKQINDIIGILQRRSSLVQYYNTLISSSKMIQSPLRKIFQHMKFIDFIIILKKITYPSDIITFLLSKQMGPIPILYQTKDKIVNDVQSLVNIIGFEQYPLIINIWTQEAVATLKNNVKINSNKESQENKPIYFSELMQIDARYFEGSTFQSNANLFKIELRNNKQVLLVDFVGYPTKDRKMQENKHALLKKILPSASLIIFHIDGQNIKQDRTGNEIFFQDYSYLFQSTAKKFFFAQNFEQFKQAVENVLVDLKVAKEQEINLFYFQSDRQTDLQQLESFSKFLDQHGFYLPISQKKRQLSKQIVSFGQQDALPASINSFLVDQKSNAQFFNFCKIRENTKQFVKTNFNQLNYKEILLPKIASLKKLYQVEDKLKKLNIFDYFQQRKIYQQSINKTIDNNTFKEQQRPKTELEKLQGQKRELVQFLAKQSLTKFVEDCRKYIRANNLQLKLLIEIMIQQKNRMMREQLLKSKKQYQQKGLDVNAQGQYIARNQKILQSGIITDSIIYQLSIYNQLTIDKKAQYQQSRAQYDINTYYSNCMDNLYPFNVINKETPTFGNAALERFFLQLNKKYQKSGVFVVSIFGTKSSGKSTLINYLFRYNISMIEDEFAKGVYMSLCKIDNKVIIILDATGILETTFGANRKEQELHLQSQQLTQQAIFDHEIASILMKQSDVVIIAGQIQPITQNNKKILSQRTTLAVGICYKVMEALHVNNQTKIKILPKKIIFGLLNRRNVQLDGVEVRNQLISDLTPLLTGQNQVQNPKQIFERYIHISLNNIIFLPNVYIGQNSNIFSEIYGLKMLEIRNNIVKQLEDLAQYRMQQNTMKEIYGDSKIHWQIIKKTGNNIVRVQSINQANIRDQIYRIFKQEYCQICQIIIRRLKQVQERANKKDNIFSITKQEIKTKIYLQKSNEEKKLLKSQGQKHFTKSYKNSWYFFGKYVLEKFMAQLSHYQKQIRLQIKNKFESQTNEITSQFKSWVNQYDPKLERLYKSILNIRIKLRFLNYDKLFQEALKQFYFGNISLIINRLDKKSINNAIQTQNEFLHQTSTFLSNVLNQHIDKTEIKLNLINVFQVLLQSQNFFKKQLQIKHINDCLSLSQQFPDNNYIYQLKEFVSFQNQAEITQQNKKSIADTIRNSVTKFIQEIKDDFFKNKSTKNVDIFEKFPILKTKINSVTQQLQQDIGQKCKNIYIQLPQIYKKKDSLKTSLKNKTQLISNQRKLLTNQLLRGEKMLQIKFYTSLSQKLQNFYNEKMSLGIINIKILLVGKLFEAIQQMIIRDQNKQIQKEKAIFNQMVQKRQVQINKEVTEKFEQLLDKDIQIEMKGYKQKLLQNFNKKIAQINEARVNQYLSHINLQLPKTMQCIIANTINNPNIQVSKDKNQLQILYSKCYKFLSNPSRFVFQQTKSHLQQNSETQNSIKKAQELIQIQIKELVQKIKKDFVIKQIDEVFDHLRQYLTKKIVKPQRVVEKILSKFKNVEQILAQIKKERKTDEQIQKELQTYIQTKEKELTGCKSCCPLCGAKCILAYNHSDGHQAYSHNILAFGGCTDQDNKFILEGCLYKDRGLKTLWVKNNIRYQTCQKMINSLFRDWKQDLPNFRNMKDKKKYNLDSLGQQTANAKDSQKPKRGQRDIQEIRWIRLWANIEEIMIQTYKQCFKSSKLPFQNESLDPLKRSALNKNSFNLQNPKQRLLDYWRGKVMINTNINEQRPTSN